MRRQRLTREEQKQQTRERLLAAAAEVFSARGFEAATVDEIAEAAGYSKGAVYSNFDGKESLFLTLIEQRLEQDRDALERSVEDGATLGHALAGIGQHTATHLAAERSWALLSIEFFLYSMRHERAKALLAQQYQAQRETLAALIGSDSGGDAIPLTPNDLASVTLAIGSGLAIQACIDDGAIPDDLLARAIDHLARVHNG